ncbi:MAG: DNA-3-methyladenine glycosylase I [bacterium]
MTDPKPTSTNTAATLIRCDWCGNDPLYQQYHDDEWGTPCRDDDKLFEFIVLEGAQAGLSWITILRKRENYRKAFCDFDPQKIARFTPKKIERLMENAGIVRNRLKIESTVTNARCFLEIQQACGSFSDYYWGFVEGRPIVNQWRTMAEIPASTPLSDAISKDMKKRGFRFFGTTICYAHMQATGMVNDHLTGCFRHSQCKAL